MKTMTLPSQQQGIVLIVVLVLLTGLTLSASVGMQQSIIQERLSGNLQDRALAFQMAEAALVDAQEMLNRLIASSPTPSPVDQRNTVVAFFGAVGGTDGLFQNPALETSPDPLIPANWNPATTGAIAHCGVVGATTPPILCSAESQAAGGQVSNLVTNGDIVAPPQYLVVHLGQAQLAAGGLIQGQASQTPPTVQLFRILARGRGGNPNTVVILDSTYAVR